MCQFSPLEIGPETVGSASHTGSCPSRAQIFSFLRRTLLLPETSSRDSPSILQWTCLIAAFTFSTTLSGNGA
jgi:hypothetical protein